MSTKAVLRLREVLMRFGDSPMVTVLTGDLDAALVATERVEDYKRLLNIASAALRAHERPAPKVSRRPKSDLKAKKGGRQ